VRKIVLVTVVERYHERVGGDFAGTLDNHTQFLTVEHIKPLGHEGHLRIEFVSEKRLPGIFPSAQQLLGTTRWYVNTRRFRAPSISPRRNILAADIIDRASFFVSRMSGATPF
jgi:hypothetical protein